MHAKLMIFIKAIAESTLTGRVQTRVLLQCPTRRLGERMAKEVVSSNAEETL